MLRKVPRWSIQREDERSSVRDNFRRGKAWVDATRSFGRSQRINRASLSMATVLVPILACPIRDLHVRMKMKI